MKNPLFRLLHILMAGVILVSSTGFGLVERSCHVRGKTMYLSLKEAQDKQCAPDQQALVYHADKTSVDKTPCCQDETTYENVDVTSSLAQLVAKFIKTVTHFIAAGLTTVVTWLAEVIFSTGSSAVVAVHAPPLPAGRSLLALIQRFLI